MLVMIDNYDSFTYNLVDYCRQLGREVAVFKNDDIQLNDLMALSPEKILLSPGPGRPEQAGICPSVVAAFAGHVPILGVCLGHQNIGLHYGANIIRATAVRHGKTSAIYHTGEGLFKGLANPFLAMRYHSLVVDKARLPSQLNVTAWTQSESGDMEEIMGLEHRESPVNGVQFHPESILTPGGKTLLANFLVN